MGSLGVEVPGQDCGTHAGTDACIMTVHSCILSYDTYMCPCTPDRSFAGNSSVSNGDDVVVYGDDRRLNSVVYLVCSFDSHDMYTPWSNNASEGE